MDALVALLLLGAPLLLGFLVQNVRPPRYRRAAFIVTGAAPLLLALLTGVPNGCSFRIGGEECFGYGFGVAMALGFLPFWAALVAVGAFLKARRSPRRH